MLPSVLSVPLVPAMCHSDETKRGPYRGNAQFLGEVTSLSTVKVADVDLRVVRFRTEARRFCSCTAPAASARTAAVRRAALRQAPADRAVASGLRQSEPAGLARQHRRHRAHLSRADGRARAVDKSTWSVARSAAGSRPRWRPRRRNACKRLVMVGPVGVKIGPADKLDIPDIFAMPQRGRGRSCSITIRPR